MMKRAFTLLELLVVIAIMGLLGTVSIGGYRAMQRGMEERGVMQNMNQFVRAAYQRAQIDRQPVCIYYWNELLQEKSATSVQVVVGKAVAVRRSGRITWKDSSTLGDEFADLRFNRYVNKEGDDDNVNEDEALKSSTWLYRLQDTNNSIQRTKVAKTTKKISATDTLLGARSAQNDTILKNHGSRILALENENYDVECYGFIRSKNDSVSWQIGDAYGFEFAEIQLPHNFIFGESSPPESASSPISGEGMIRFYPGESNSASITVSAMRPDSSGQPKPKAIGKTEALQ